MVTGELMFRFIRAFPYNYKIIIIGDINQLQPIGFCSVMRQLMDSKRVPVFRSKVKSSCNATCVVRSPVINTGGNSYCSNSFPY